MLFCDVVYVFSHKLNFNVGEWGGELRGSRLEAWMKSHKSEVADELLSPPPSEVAIT